ncbi:MAG: archaemetzincin family Zn-dependent metalloprotease [Chlorobi bacterium]|nr:archaemetzincin family Zn-dependent metalloprotease [Chlorobiota bacterium]
MRAQLEIFTLNFFQHELLIALREWLALEFNLHSLESSFSFSLDESFDPARRQYHATRIWEQVLKARQGSHHKLLVITEYDLFIPVLTFVFGEAQLGGRAGIVSICRLLESFYGLVPNQDLLFQRLCKEVVHELGHLYGLRHCYMPSCVMGPSTTVERVDAKEWKFCPECLETFARAREDLAMKLSHTPPKKR